MGGGRRNARAPQNKDQLLMYTSAIVQYIEPSQLSRARKGGKAVLYSPDHRAGLAYRAGFQPDGGEQALLLCVNLNYNV